MKQQTSWTPWAALAGVLFYFLMFFNVPFPGLTGADGTPLSRAFYLFFYLLRPDDLVAGWFGEPASLAVLDRLPVLFLAGSILGVAFCVGRLLMGLCRIDRELTRLETFVFSMGVGLNAVSTYVLAVGLLGWLDRSTAFVLPGLVVVGLVGWMRFGRKTSPEEPSRASKTDDVDPGGLSPRWLWLAVPFALAILLGSMLPPIEFDVREYHLQAPKEFFQQGYVGFLPHNLYANMALGTEMFSLLGMVLAGDWWLGSLVGKTVIGAFAPLTALGLFAAGQRFATRSVGIVAAIVFLSTPWIVQVSTYGLVEGASAFYLLMTVYALLLWQRDERRRLALVALTGYLAGGAVSVKYPGLLFVAIPMAVWIAWTARATGWKSLAKPMAVYTLGGLLGCGLWFAKNWVLTGNPTYPLLYGLFGGETWTAEKTAMWNHVHQPRDFSSSAFTVDLGRVLLRSDWLSPLLVPLAALAFVRPKRRRLAVGLIAYFGFILAAWWILALRIDRYWIHGLPLVALLAGMGVCWSSEKTWRRGILALLVFGCLSNLFVSTSRPCVYDRFFVPLDRLRRSPERIDVWHAYFNEHVDDGRVLLVGEAQVFDLEMPILYNTWLDDSIFERLVLDPTGGELRPTEKIRAAFSDEGITHVYVHWGELARYRQTEYGDTSRIQPEVFDRLVARGILEPILADAGRAQHSGRGYRVRSGSAVE